MYAVTTTVKWMAIIGLLGLGGWIGYHYYTKEPPSSADVAIAIHNIASVVGDEKTDLTRSDASRVEFQVGKLSGYDMQLIVDAYSEFLNPSVSQEVAAELILLRIFKSKPGGYKSRIDGDPWEVSGDLINLSLFEIVRTENEIVPLSVMVTAFVSSSEVRSGWSGETSVTIPELPEPTEIEEDVEY